VKTAIGDEALDEVLGDALERKMLLINKENPHIAQCTELR